MCNSGRKVSSSNTHSVGDQPVSLPGPHWVKRNRLGQVPPKVVPTIYFHYFHENNRYKEHYSVGQVLSHRIIFLIIVITVNYITINYAFLSAAHVTISISENIPLSLLPLLKHTSHHISAHTHCLGTIIVQQALKTAEKQKKKFKNMSKCLVGEI